MADRVGQKNESALGAPRGDMPPAAPLPPPVVEIVRPTKKRTVRRHSDPFTIVDKIKLWPSKTGVLHGVRSVKLRGGIIEVHTHCGQSARVRNSRSGRLARHLRNKSFEKPCPRCRIPAWKIEKFEETSFI